MPFCDQCGAENPAWARFCDQCGAPMQPVASLGSPPPASASPLAPASPPGTCPQCGAAVIPGQAFCDECGAPLGPALAQPASDNHNASVPPAPSGGQVVPPQQSYPAPQPMSFPSNPSPAPMPLVPNMPPAAAPSHGTLLGMQLVVATRGISLPLPASDQVLIGRADPVSNVYPDIDLTPHGGLEQGVGRRHLRLFVQNGQIMAEDLNSTNGTHVNGQRLPPKAPHSVQHGDELRLGNLSLHLHIP